MEKIINLHIKKLPEGVYLATSEDVQGLVVQADTAAEAIDIARDVAVKLLESQAQMRRKKARLKSVGRSFNCPTVVAYG